MPDLTTLTRLAATLGVPLDEAVVDRFDRYLDLLLEWNQRVNLTAVRDPEEIQVKLFGDALALVPLVRRYQSTQPPGRPIRLVDVGTGAGFPGLPLKLVDPALDLLMIEATSKKARFVETVIGALDLPGARVVHGRAEELARQPAYRARFDVVTARAVARLPTLLEYCLPLLRRGGWGLFPKGREAEEEVAEAARALDILQARLVAVETIEVPELAGTRIVVVEETGTVPPRYPRPAGQPAKRPL